MLLAVVIGLSLRPLHRRVDSFVDHVFFAARHRDADALLLFGDECDQIESRERLVERTVETVHRFGRVDGCAILLADDDGDLQEVAAADYHTPPLAHDSLVTLRLRTSRKPLERGAGSPLDIADVAFPIPGRNRLAGALLCVLTPHAEPFSPEEFQALERLAHHLGAALLGLDAADAPRLRLENAILRERTPRSAPRSARR
jgi:GAF domain-containing protein